MKNQRSNVRVVLRVRERQLGEDADVCVKVSKRDCEVNAPGRGRFLFAFDDCFGGQQPNGQEDVFNGVGRPVIEALVKGYNSCILSYGPTGSGKTFSVFGPPSSCGTPHMGLIPRICGEVFLATKSFIGARVSVSVVEVYMDAVFDLLNARKELKVRTEPNSQFRIVGARQPVVETYSDVVELLKESERLRTVASTAVHERSSRAHTIFELSLSSTSTEGRVACSKIALVDLAGCERVKDSRTESGVALDQACNINLSLLTLGCCIEAVVTKKRSTAGEFRNSTLTKILKEYLVGNSLTTLMVNVAPTIQDCNMTIHALRFTERAKQLQTTVSRTNVVVSQESELSKRLEAIRRERDAELEVERVNSEVFKLESDYAQFPTSDLAHTLEEAIVVRNRAEDALEVLRKECYPREFALRSELECLKAAFEDYRDEKESEVAHLSVRLHEQRDEILSEHLEVIGQLQAALKQAESRCNALNEHNSKLQRSLDVVRGELEGEKSQLLLNCNLLVEEQAKQNEDTVRELEKHNRSLAQELKRQIATCASTKSLLDSERARSNNTMFRVDECWKETCEFFSKATDFFVVAEEAKVQHFCEGFSSHAALLNIAHERDRERLTASHMKTRWQLAQVVKQSTLAKNALSSIPEVFQSDTLRAPLAEKNENVLDATFL